MSNKWWLVVVRNGNKKGEADEAACLRFRVLETVLVLLSQVHAAGH